jgi:hypothetical protein
MNNNTKKSALPTKESEQSASPALTARPARPPTYPARPIDGGRLELCTRSRIGDWYAEPKYNGWRAFVHVPTATMFNRRGELLSIAAEFAEALAALKKLPIKWADTEALSRRHGIGKGSLILFDFLGGSPEFWEALGVQTVPRMGGLADASYRDRKRFLACAANLAGIEAHIKLETPIQDNTVYLAPAYRADGARVLYDALKVCNADPATRGLRNPLDPAQEVDMAGQGLGCDFFEGIVMKRADALYPLQLRDPEADTHVWVKHRWHF